MPWTAPSSTRSRWCRRPAFRHAGFARLRLQPRLDDRHHQARHRHRARQLPQTRIQGQPDARLHAPDQRRHHAPALPVPAAGFLIGIVHPDWPPAQGAASLPAQSMARRVMMDELESAVARHYGLPELAQLIETALAAAGLGTDRIAPEALAPLDEFHIGGRAATAHVVGKMALTPGSLCARCRLWPRRRHPLHRRHARLPGHRHRSHRQLYRRRPLARGAHWPGRPHRLSCRQRTRHAIRRRHIREFLQVRGLGPRTCLSERPA